MVSQNGRLSFLYNRRGAQDEAVATHEHHLTTLNATETRDQVVTINEVMHFGKEWIHQTR